MFHFWLFPSSFERSTKWVHRRWQGRWCLSGGRSTQVKDFHFADRVLGRLLSRTLLREIKIAIWNFTFYEHAKSINVDGFSKIRSLNIMIQLWIIWNSDYCSAYSSWWKDRAGVFNMEHGVRTSCPSNPIQSLRVIIVQTLRTRGWCPMWTKI